MKKHEVFELLMCIAIFLAVIAWFGVLFRLVWDFVMMML